jgi:RNA 3'-terminal phosphate cyclase (ATP)
LREGINFFGSRQGYRSPGGGHLTIVRIDGSHGEGGGQILRTALSLSAITGKPFIIENIRARRSKPGLMRQHLTAVKAAAEICDAWIEGGEPGSMCLSFEPNTPVRGGDFCFSIGTAGSTTLVLQTVLLPLALAAEPSRVVVRGGTHNIGAPPFEFLDHAFLPLLRKIGFDIGLRLHRPGFYPAGGGEIAFETRSAQTFHPLVLEERGGLISQSAEAVVANLPFHIAERELAHVCARLGWPRDLARGREETRADGPGNCLLLTLAFENISQVVTAFGQRNVSSEAVAEEAARAVLAYLETLAPVGSHLADQLLLPMALAAGGRLITSQPSSHTLTNMDVIQKFIDVDIDAVAKDQMHWQITVEPVA